MKKLVFLLLILFSIQMTSFASDYWGYGIEIKKQNEKYIIDNVLENSKADEIGIKNGMNIVKINGKKIEKITDETLNSIDKKYKNLKILTDKNEQITLKPENITLVKTYNNVQDTFNEQTKYSIDNYKTEKVILSEYLNTNKHVKYLNAYLNYAEAISTNNLKELVELFKITQKNVQEAISKAKTDVNSSFYQKYTECLNNKNKESIYSNTFKSFLEILLYFEQNQELINRQINEFNDNQKKLFAKFVYNSKITANLFRDVETELYAFLFKHSYDVAKLESWKREINVERKLYNNGYKNLVSLIKKNKIEFEKPGLFSNFAQTSLNPPAIKWITDKQVVATAEAVGYKTLVPTKNNKTNSELSANNNSSINSPKEELTFFGGFKYDSQITDVLKYFDSLPSVKRIDIPKPIKLTIPVTNYHVYRNSHKENISLKGKITNNLINNIFLSYPLDIFAVNGAYKTLKLSNGKNIKVIDNAFTFTIENVYIAGIPFNLSIILTAQPEYVFFDKNYKLTYFNNMVIPRYEISHMQFYFADEEHDVTYYEAELRNLLNLYKQKYNKFYVNKGSYVWGTKVYETGGRNNNNLIFGDNKNIVITMEWTLGTIEINYFNSNYDRFKNKYDEYIKNSNKQKYKEQSLNEHI